jgi:hypothetical protein
MTVETFLGDSRYYRGDSLILAFCNDERDLKGLLVCGRSRDEIEARLPGSDDGLISVGGHGHIVWGKTLNAKAHVRAAAEEKRHGGHDLSGPGSWH